MHAFVWTMTILMALEAIGKAVKIRNRDFERNPQYMVVDIAIAIALITWAAWLLGNNA